MGKTEVKLAQDSEKQFTLNKSICKADRSSVVKLCVNKLARIEDPESKLHKAVLINNTLRNLQKQEKKQLDTNYYRNSELVFETDTSPAANISQNNAIDFSDVLNDFLGVIGCPKIADLQKETSAQQHYSLFRENIT